MLSCFSEVENKGTWRMIGEKEVVEVTKTIGIG
jgi:hypothetical protein